MSKNWINSTIENSCNIEYGTRVVRKRDSGDIYSVYGGGGATFKMDTYNREDRMVIARFAMSKKCTRFIKGKFFLNDSGLTISQKDEKEIDIRFLNYKILSLNEKIYSIGRGTAQRNLNSEAFKNLDFSYPNTLKEQKQIVEILDTAFEALEKAKINLEKNIKNTKELFDSKLNEIFSQKREGWEEKTLGEVCIMIKRGIPPKYVENEGLTVINQKCIRNHKINLELSRLHNFNLKSVAEEKLIKIGDVLINSTGTGTLGRVAQVRDIEFEGCTVDTHVTIVRPDSDLFYMDFFGYALIKIESEIEKSGEGTSGQTELGRTKLQNNFLINYPNCKNLQKEIVLILDSLVLKTKQLEQKYQQKLDNLEELKKSLLQKAFSGELTK